MAKKICLTSLLVLAALTISMSASGSGASSSGDIGLRTLDSIVDKYGPVKFDHTLHTNIAENCWQCHHEHSKTAASCRDCHAIKPEDFKRALNATFMPCRNCHTDYDPSVPNMPGLKAAYHRQCLQCHRGMNNVGVEPKGCTNQCHERRANNGEAKVLGSLQKEDK